MNQPPEIRMGNDIARQFGHVSPEQAETTIADHLQRFWPPPLRAKLLSRVEAGDVDELDPLIVGAAERLRASAG